jgi:cell division protein FtsI (penicillin-binding protein 3)
VAGPVFKAIAEEVYLSLPEPIESAKGIAEWKIPTHQSPEEALKKNYLPSLSGLTAMEAISLLENHGIRVQVSGSGKVKSQDPPIGTAVYKNMVVKINLG